MGLLLEDLEEAGMGGSVAAGVAFATPSPDAVGFSGVGYGFFSWSGLHFPVDTACISRWLFCPFFASGAGFHQALRAVGGPK